MIRIIIADDQVLLRETLKNIVEQNSDIKVVALASDGKEAFNLCQSLQPDMILLDIKMPKLDGLQAASLIKENCPQIKILMLTTFYDNETVAKALGIGADGYVSKDIKPIDLIFAIKNTLNGFSIIQNCAYDTVLNKFKTTEEIEDDKEFELSDKEIEIIKLIAAGNSNKEIASLLYIAEGTVKNILTTIYEKLNLRDRIQLAVFAVKHKIV